MKLRILKYNKNINDLDFSCMTLAILSNIRHMTFRNRYNILTVQAVYDNMSPLEKVMYRNIINSTYGGLSYHGGFILSDKKPQGDINALKFIIRWRLRRYWNTKRKFPLNTTGKYEIDSLRASK